MNEPHTTAAIQHYLNELADVRRDSPPEPIVSALLGRAVKRLQMLCASLLYRSYPRLTQPPLILQTDEVLSAVMERLIKAMRQVRPVSVRQFFALANQHIRWELNDLARRLDERAPAGILPEGFAAPDDSSESSITPDARRMLEAIEALPEAEREVFCLVRIQGLNQSEVAELLEVSTKTIQRRLNRSLVLLSVMLPDLKPDVPKSE